MSATGRQEPGSLPSLALTERLDFDDAGAGGFFDDILVKFRSRHRLRPSQRS
jgi:hypothetical protein